MKPRQIFSILLGIVVFSMVVIFGFLVLLPQVFATFSESEYGIARQKWANRTFSKYRLTVQSGYTNRLMSYMDSCIYDVEVENEKVLSTYPTDTCGTGPSSRTKYTISGLFDWIKEYKPSAEDECGVMEEVCGCVGHLRLISEYDMSLGYPSSIRPYMSGERRWLYPEFWMDLIGQKPCSPISRFTEGHEFEVKLLQPLP